MTQDTVTIEIESPLYSTSTSIDSSGSSGSVTDFQNAQNCLEEPTEVHIPELKTEQVVDKPDQIDGRRHSRMNTNHNSNSYAASKNVAEGMMDIALLSANANQLRFLITYNSESSTYYISLGLIVLSLVMQVCVGIALIFKHRMKRSNGKHFTRTNEILVGGVFMVTVVNILLAAFTTTDIRK